MNPYDDELEPVLNLEVGECFVMGTSWPQYYCVISKGYGICEAQTARGYIATFYEGGTFDRRFPQDAFLKKEQEYSN